MSNFNVETNLPSRDFTSSILQVYEAASYVIWHQELCDLLASKNVHFTESAPWDNEDESWIAKNYDEVNNLMMMIDVANVARLYESQTDPIIRERQEEFIQRIGGIGAISKMEDDLKELKRVRCYNIPTAR